MNVKCQEYKEVNGIEELCVLLSPQDGFQYKFLQLKYDGIWARIVFGNDGEYRVYSKTGQQKDKQRTPQTYFVHGNAVILIGEYMFGSQWAERPDRKGKIFVFDCIQDGDDIATLPYNRRYQIAESVVKALGDPRFVMVKNYEASKVGDLWLEIESKESHEGLILRDWRSTYYTTLTKLKRSVEDDFVVMEVLEGQGKHQGRMGSLRLGQYDPEDGHVHEVMDVGGGFSDLERELIWENRTMTINRVCLVEGKSRFSSGALRHPNFVRFRDDKTPKECILKKT